MTIKSLRCTRLLFDRFISFLRLFFFFLYGLLFRFKLLSRDTLTLRRVFPETAIIRLSLVFFWLLDCQEGDTTDRRHVAGVTRDADLVVQQLHGALQPDPRGRQLVLRTWWWRYRGLGSHDTRAQDLGARV